MSTPPLEQRIAAALTPTDITSTDLAALIAEVEAAAAAADAAAAKSREQALDPAIVIDVAQVSAEVTAVELTRDRLQAALPRLRTCYTEVREQEDIAKWQAEAAPLQERRVVLGTKFGKDYPKLMNEVLHQLRDMWALDQEINALNRRRPDNAGALVELITPAFSKYLKIPDPAMDAKRWEHESGYLWPPQQPNLTLQMLAAMRPDPSSSAKRPRAPTSRSVTVAYWRTTGGRSPRPSSASASSKSRRPPRLRPPRSATGRLIASAGGRADNSLG
jgi:hypothetical protein